MSNRDNAASPVEQPAAAPKPVVLEHVAVAEDGGRLRWMTGRKPRDCELYTAPDGCHAPFLYVAPQPAPAPADERAAFERHQGYPRPEYDGAAQEAWDYHRKTWLAALAFARASSANETGAEGATDSNGLISRPDLESDPLWQWRCIANEAEVVVNWKGKFLMLSEEMCVRLGSVLEDAARAPAQAPELVAIPAGWKLVPIEPVAEMQIPSYLPDVDWPTRRRIYHDMVAAAPQPTAQADARERLTDEQHAKVRLGLTAAKKFIANGIELGFIRMPDADCPDPAHDTPKLIDEALALLKGANNV